jgi:hypothetical protein
MRVSAAQRTVYTIGVGVKRTYLRKDAAYYALAKQMVLARYPAPMTDGGEDHVCRYEASGHGMTLEVWRSRQARREELFHIGSTDGYGDEIEHFSTDKWQRFIRRLARYLQFVDERGGK